MEVLEDNDVSPAEFVEQSDKEQEQTWNTIIVKDPGAEAKVQGAFDRECNATFKSSDFIVTSRELVKENALNPGYSAKEQTCDANVICNVDLADFLKEAKAVYEDPSQVPAWVKKKADLWPVTGKNGPAVVNIVFDMPEGFSAGTPTATFDSDYISKIDISASEDGKKAVAKVTLNQNQQFGKLFAAVGDGSVGSVQLAIPTTGAIEQDAALDQKVHVSGDSHIYHMTQFGIALSVNVTITPCDVDLITSTTTSWKESDLQADVKLSASDLLINGKSSFLTTTNSPLELTSTLDLSAYGTALKTVLAQDPAAAASSLRNPAVSFTQTWTFADGIDIQSLQAGVEGLEGFSVSAPVIEGNQATFTFAPESIPSSIDELNALADKLSSANVTVTLTGAKVKEDAASGQAMTVSSQSTGLVAASLDTAKGGYYALNYGFSQNTVSSAEVKIPEPIDVKAQEVPIETTVSSEAAETNADGSVDTGTPFTIKGKISNASALKTGFSDLMQSYGLNASDTEAFRNADFRLTMEIDLPMQISHDATGTVTLSESDAFKILNTSIPQARARDAADKITVELGLNETAANDIDALVDELNKLEISVSGFSLNDSAENDATYEIPATITGRLSGQVTAKTGQPYNVALTMKDATSHKVQVVAREINGVLEENINIPLSASINKAASADVKSSDDIVLSASFETKPVQERLAELVKTFEAADSSVQEAVTLSDMDCVFTATFQLPKGVDVSKAQLELDHIPTLKDSPAFVNDNEKSIVVEQTENGPKLAVSLSLAKVSSLADLTAISNALNGTDPITVSISGLQAADDLEANTWKELTTTLNGHLNAIATFTKKDEQYKAVLTFTSMPVATKIRRLEPVNMSTSVSVPASVRLGNAEAGKTYRTEREKPFSATGTVDLGAVKERLTGMSDGHPELSEEAEKLAISKADLSFTAHLNVPSALLKEESYTATLSDLSVFEVKSTTRDLTGLNVTIGLKDNVSISNLSDLFALVNSLPDSISVEVGGLSLPAGATANQTFEVSETVNGSLVAEMSDEEGIPYAIQVRFNGVGPNLAASAITTAPSGELKQEISLPGSMSINGKSREDVEVDTPFALTSTLDVSSITGLFKTLVDNKDGQFESASAVRLADDTKFEFTASYSFPVGTDLSGLSVSMPEGSPFQAELSETDQERLTAKVKLTFAQAPKTLEDLANAASTITDDQIVLTMNGLKATADAANNKELNILGSVIGSFTTVAYFSDDIFYPVDLSFVTSSVSAAYRVLKTQEYAFDLKVPAWVEVENTTAGQTARKKPGRNFSLVGSVDSTPIHNTLQSFVNAGSTSSSNPENVRVDGADLLFDATFTLPEPIICDTNAFAVTLDEQTDASFVVKSAAWNKDSKTIEAKLALKDASSVRNMKDLIDVANGTPETISIHVDGVQLVEKTYSESDVFTISGVVSGKLDALVYNGDGLPFHFNIGFPGTGKSETQSLQTKVAPVVPTVIEKSIDLSGSMSIDGQAAKDLAVSETFSLVSTLDLRNIAEILNAQIENKEDLYDQFGQAGLSNTEFGFTAAYTLPEGIEVGDVRAVLRSAGENCPFRVKSASVTRSKITITLALKNDPASMADLLAAAQDAGNTLTLTLSNLRATSGIAKNTPLAITGTISGSLKTDVDASDEVTLRPVLTFSLPEAVSASIRVLETVELNHSMDVDAWLSPVGLRGGTFSRRANVPFALKGSLDTSEITNAMRELVSHGDTSGPSPELIPVKQADLKFTARIDMPDGIDWKEDGTATLILPEGRDSAFKVLSVNKEGKEVVAEIGFADDVTIDTLQDLMAATSSAPTPLALNVDGFFINDPTVQEVRTYSVGAQISGKLDVLMSDGDGVPYHAVVNFNGRENAEKGGLHVDVQNVIPTVISKSYALNGALNVDGQEKKDFTAADTFTLNSSLDISEIHEIFNTQFENKDELFEEFSQAELSDTEFGFTAVYTFPDGVDLSNAHAVLKDSASFVVSDPVVSGQQLTVTFALGQEPKTMADLAQVAQKAGSSLELSLSGLRFKENVPVNTWLDVNGTITGSLKTSVAAADDLILRPEISFTLANKPTASLRVLKDVLLEVESDVPAWIEIDGSKFGVTPKKRIGERFAISGNIDTLPIHKAMDALVNAGSTSSTDPKSVPVHAADLTFRAEFELPAGMSWDDTGKVTLDGAEAFAVKSAALEGGKVVVTIGFANPEAIQTLQDLTDVASATGTVITMQADGFYLNDTNASADQTYTIKGAVNGQLAAYVSTGDGIPYAITCTFKGVEDTTKGTLTASVAPVVAIPAETSIALNGEMKVDGQAKKDVEIGADFAVVSTLDLQPVRERFVSILNKNEELLGDLSNVRLSESEFTFQADYTFPQGIDLDAMDVAMTKSGPFEIKESALEGNVLHVTFGMKNEPASMASLLLAALESGDTLELTLSHLKASDTIIRNRDLAITGTLAGTFETNAELSHDTILHPVISFTLSETPSVSVRVLEEVELSVNADTDSWLAVEGSTSGTTVSKRLNKEFAVVGSIDTKAIRDAMDGLVSAGSTSSISPERIPVDAANLTYTARFMLPEGVSWNETAKAALTDSSVFKVLDTKREGDAVIVTMGFDEKAEIRTLADLLAAAADTPAELSLTVGGFAIADEHADASSLYVIRASVSGTLDARLKTHENIPYHVIVALQGRQAEGKSLEAAIRPVVPAVAKKDVTINGIMSVEGEARKDVEPGKAFRVESSLDLQTIRALFDSLTQAQLGSSLEDFSLSETDFAFEAVYTFPEGVDLSETVVSFDQIGPFEIVSSKPEGKTLTVTFALKDEPKTMADLASVAELAGTSLNVLIYGIKAESEIQKNTALPITGTLDGRLVTRVDVDEETILQPELTFHLGKPAQTAIRVLEAVNFPDIEVSVPAWISSNGQNKLAGKPFVLTGSVDLGEVKSTMNNLVSSGSVSGTQPERIPVDAANLNFTATIALPEGVTWDDKADATLNAEGFAITGKKREGSNVVVTLGFAHPETITNLAELTALVAGAPAYLDLNLGGFAITPAAFTDENAFTLTGSMEGSLHADIRTHDNIPVSVSASFTGTAAEGKSLSATVKPVLPQAVEQSITLSGSMKVNGQDKADLALNKDFTLTSSLDLSDLQERFGDILDKHADELGELNKAVLDQTEFGFIAEYTFPAGVDLTWAKAELGATSPFKVVDTTFDGQNMTVNIGLRKQPQTMKELQDVAFYTGDSIDLSISGLQAREAIAINTSLTITGTLRGRLETNVTLEDSILRPQIAFELPGSVSASIRVIEKVTVDEIELDIPAWLQVDSRTQRINDPFTITGIIDASIIKETLHDMQESGSALAENPEQVPVDALDLRFHAELSLPSGVSWKEGSKAVLNTEDFTIAAIRQDGAHVDVEIALKDASKIATVADLAAVVEKLPAALSLDVEGFAITDPNAVASSTYTISGTAGGSLVASLQTLDGIPYDLSLAFTGQAPADQADKALQVTLTPILKTMLEDTVDVPVSVQTGSKKPGESLCLENGDTFTISTSVSPDTVADAIKALMDGGSYTDVLTGAGLTFTADYTLPDGIEWNGKLSDITLSDPDHFEVLSASKGADGKVSVTVGLKQAGSLETLGEFKDLLSFVKAPLVITAGGFKVNDPQYSADSTYGVDVAVNGKLSGQIQDPNGVVYTLDYDLAGKADADKAGASIKGVKTTALVHAFELGGRLTIDGENRHDIVKGETITVEHDIDISPVLDQAAAWLANRVTGSLADKPADSTRFTFEADYTFPQGVDLTRVKAAVQGNPAIAIDTLSQNGSSVHITYRLARSIRTLQDLKDILEQTGEDRQMHVLLSQISTTQDMPANVWNDVSAKASGSFDGNFRISEPEKVAAAITFDVDQRVAHVNPVETIALNYASALGASVAINDKAAGSTDSVEAGKAVTLHGLLSLDKFREDFARSTEEQDGEPKDVTLSKTALVFDAVFTLADGMKWDGTLPTIAGMHVSSAVKSGNTVRIRFSLNLANVKTLADLQKKIAALPKEINVTLPGVSAGEASIGKTLQADVSAEGDLDYESKAPSGRSFVVHMDLSGKSKATNLLTVKANTVKAIPMYRLYNPNSGEHFYTADEHERKVVIAAGWNDEGIGWYAPEKSKIPVYRLYNANAGDHHYTLSEKERDYLVKAGWKYEGIGWYSDEAHSVPLYREYNPNAKAGAHNFTTSIGEHEFLGSIGWKTEGIAWYGVPTPQK